MNSYHHNLETYRVFKVTDWRLEAKFWRLETHFGRLETWQLETKTGG